MEKMAYRFPGRPPGTDLSDSDSFSMASSLGDYEEGNEDCLASFAEDFRHSLDADANEDDNFWRRAISDDNYYIDGDDDDDDSFWSLQQHQQ